MPPASTRRTFLKLSAAGLGTVATSKIAASPATASNASSYGTEDTEPIRTISVWVTDPHSRCAPSQAVTWRRGTSPDPGIVLDPSKKFQTILGFGAAFTDAACYMFNQLREPEREALFHEMFHSSEMGLNVCRTCMGASDYSTKIYSYDEGEPDPKLKRFSVEHDREYILPILRQARKMNPDLFLFSKPWSPPGWMKSGGSMLGGSMRRK